MPTDPMVDRILDAALEAATVHGVTRTSMSDVADRAAISRPTLYKRFGSKDELVAAVVAREANRMIRQVLDAVAPVDDPTEAIETAALVALRAARGRRHLHRHADHLGAGDVPTRPDHRPPGGLMTSTSTPLDTAADRRWHDPKRYLWLIGLVVPLLPFGAYRLATATGLDVFWWMGPIWIAVLMPLADTVFGVDRSNPPDWAVPQLEADHWYRWATYLFLPLQFASLVWSAWYVTQADLSLFAFLGLTLTVGTVSGVAINTAHELGHKRDKLERRLSKVALAPSAYGHFYVGHNRGHHVRVSTPDDPASGSRTAATRSAGRNTAGTATTSPPTWPSITSSGTPTTTPTPPGGTSRCGTSTTPPSSPPGAPA
jgi:AcrR family transcriptional regulator